jgi:threonine aldolase
VIELRSDVFTQPSDGMRRAMAEAVVGDEQEREDPTVAELERRGAELLGQEEAVFVPTATMANQIALRVLSRPGEELLAEENAHVLISEQGGAAVFSGLMTRGLPGRDGQLTTEQIRAAVRERDSLWEPTTGVVAIENTHNSSGGRVWPLHALEAVSATCRELGLGLHLDGARLMNAATALGVSSARIGRHADTVTLCLSKGLGCPLGALVAGSAERMRTARRFKHLFGGAMRQAGIVAAAGLYAFDHNLERLAEDHARARRLAEGLAAAGVPVDLDQVETNFVLVDVAPLGLTRADALERLHVNGVALSGTIHPTVLRAVTHLGVGDEDIDRAIATIPRDLGVLAPA